ncbi:MAG: glycosyltransferase family 9 protein [Burkholderiaceae bacterium]|nr:glycosyltransferase family 9 protein [Burkholderiaceae bacterium]MCD8515895.1 glycosyltransferase family 9 protein [Burkholderiaceae bacterium]MCD8565690.1 glycosyltransferase family 9 protein [Burkholderiaceae bacterium]
MKRILVVRNDKIGDFMLAWPALALLKSAGCHVTVLVPSYTEPLARLCHSVDDVILDPGEQASAGRQADLLALIIAANFDAALTLFSTWRVGKLLRNAGIELRMAPATKLAQILYNRRVTQRRSRSEKPEWEYNLDLAAALLKDLSLPIGSVASPYLRLDSAEVAARRQDMAASLSLPMDKRWLMVHAGSGGSANNLDIAQYEGLVTALSKRLPDWVFVLTAGPAEELAVGHLMANLINRQVPVAMRIGGDLADFARDISVANAFVAGSTGPLHIAGALDVPTIGFYPLRRSATALRWQTLNSPKRRLAISPTASMPDPESFKGLDVDAVADQIAAWLEASPGQFGAEIDEAIGI